jgi:hypothetical protein
MKAWQKTLVALGSVMAPGAAMAAPGAETLSPLSSALALSNATAPAVQLQEEAEVESRISGFVGMTVTHEYISRWLIQENEGAQFQPYAEIDFSLFDEKEGFVKSSYVFAGIWNSLHTTSPGNPGNELGGWYEFDWYVGIAASLGGGFSGNVQYVEFLSPGGSFASNKNIILNLGFDDSPYLDKFALKPYIQVLWELEDKAGAAGGDGSEPDEGLYLEIGVNPGLTLMEESEYPVSLSVPIAFGFSVTNFYNDAGGEENHFGGARVGVAAGVPLAFMNGKGYGDWSASGNVSYWFFGDGTTDANTAAAADDPDDITGDLVVTVGVQCNF